MGTNRLNSNFQAGDKITDDHVKQCVDALTGDIVGRDELGRPSDQERAGTPEYPFDEVNTKRLRVGGRGVFPETLAQSKYQLVSGPTYRAPLGEVADESNAPTVRQKVDMGWPFFLRPSVNGKRIYLHATELQPIVGDVAGTFLNIREPIYLDITDAGSGFPSLGVQNTQQGPPPIGDAGELFSSNPTTAGKNYLGERMPDYHGEIDFASINDVVVNKFRINAELEGAQSSSFTIGSLEFKNRRIYGFCYTLMTNEPSNAGRRLYTFEPTVGRLERTGLQTIENGVLEVSGTRRNVGFIRNHSEEVPASVQSTDIVPESAMYHCTEDEIFFNQNAPSETALNNFCVGLTVFITEDRTLTLTARKPIRSPIRPSDGEINDYWYDSANDQWKRFNGVDWSDFNVVPLGIAYFNGWVIVATESFHFNRERSNLNEVRSTLGEVLETGYRFTNAPPAAGRISVNGREIDFNGRWDVLNANGPDDATRIETIMENPASYVRISHGLPTERESGPVDPVNTRPIYFYVGENGSPVYDTRRPVYLTELKGYYHPFMMARCVASTPFSFYDPDNVLKKTLEENEDPSHDYEGINSVRAMHFHEKYNTNSQKDLILHARNLLDQS